MVHFNTDSAKTKHDLRFILFHLREDELVVNANSTPIPIHNTLYTIIHPVIPPHENTPTQPWSGQGSGYRVISSFLT